MIAEVDFKALGLTISKYRYEANLTQEKLAECIGVSTNFIGNIERGVSKLSVKTLFNISLALNMPLDILLESSIVRIIDDQDDHTLRDAASGYYYTLTAQLLAAQHDENNEEVLSGDELASRFGILDIDDQYLQTK